MSVCRRSIPSHSHVGLPEWGGSLGSDPPEPINFVVTTTGPTVVLGDCALSGLPLQQRPNPFQPTYQPTYQPCAWAFAMGNCTLSDRPPLIFARICRFYDAFTMFKNGHAERWAVFLSLLCARKNPRAARTESALRYLKPSQLDS